jgi:hypothetical protein
LTTATWPGRLSNTSARRRRPRSCAATASFAAAASTLFLHFRRDLHSLRMVPFERDGELATIAQVLAGGGSSLFRAGQASAKRRCWPRLSPAPQFEQRPRRQTAPIPYRLIPRLRAGPEFPKSERSIALSGWGVAVYVSVALWLAIVTGNAALYAVHPARHWPLLETVEALQAASFIPVALLMHRLNRESGFSLPITAVGVLAMLVGAAIDMAYATEVLSFGEGPIGGTAFYAAELVVLVWLLSANVLGWRNRALPPRMALIGIASAATATLLYPVWAIWLSRLRPPIEVV